MPVVGLSDAEILAVIPACNSSDLTIRCIEHLRKSTESVAVLYVDNGSSEDHLRLVEGSCGGISRICFGENRGFTAAVQEGFRLAIELGKNLLILNNDCFVSDVCISRMAAAMHRHTLGSVCPLTRDRGVCSLHKWRNRREAKFRREDVAMVSPQPKLRRRAVGVRRVLPWFCCLLNHRAIGEVPYLPDSESMRTGLGVDDWWSIKAGRSGWAHAIALDAFAEHIHSETFRRLEINRRAEQKKAVAWLRKNL